MIPVFNFALCRVRYRATVDDGAERARILPVVPNRRDWDRL